MDVDNNGSVNVLDIRTQLAAFGSYSGDANFDGQVNALDLNQVGVNWQVQSGATWADGDFSCDGMVNALDLNEVGVNWQAGIAAPAAIVVVVADETPEINNALENHEAADIPERQHKQRDTTLRRWRTSKPNRNFVRARGAQVMDRFVALADDALAEWE